MYVVISTTSFVHYPHTTTSNKEIHAHASELQENIEEMLPQYNRHSDLCSRFRSTARNSMLPVKKDTYHMERVYCCTLLAYHIV